VGVVCESIVVQRPLPKSNREYDVARTGWKTKLVLPIRPFAGRCMVLGMSSGTVCMEKKVLNCFR